MSMCAKEVIKDTWPLLLMAFVATVISGIAMWHTLTQRSEATDAYWLCMEDQTGEKLDLPQSAAANAVALHCVKHKIERRT